MLHQIAVIQMLAVRSILHSLMFTQLTDILSTDRMVLRCCVSSSTASISYSVAAPEQHAISQHLCLPLHHHAMVLHALAYCTQAIKHCYSLNAARSEPTNTIHCCVRRCVSCCYYYIYNRENASAAIDGLHERYTLEGGPRPLVVKFADNNKRGVVTRVSKSLSYFLKIAALNNSDIRMKSCLLARSSLYLMIHALCSI
jgi:hypothetical protein